MKIAVTDANIFIDIIKIGLTKQFFALPIEAHTSLEVLAELKDHQSEILAAYQYVGKLKVHNFEPEELMEMHILTPSNRLSDPDKTVIYLAVKHQAMLLSSDGMIRKFAKEQGIETHGQIWLFDELVARKQITQKIACNKINALLDSNKRYKEDAYLANECLKRLKLWSE
jgi:hypothetical protein